MDLEAVEKFLLVPCLSQANLHWWSSNRLADIMASADFGVDFDTHTQRLLFGALRPAPHEEADLVYGWTALYSSFGST